MKYQYWYWQRLDRSREVLDPLLSPPTHSLYRQRGSTGAFRGRVSIYHDLDSRSYLLFSERGSSLPPLLAFLLLSTSSFISFSLFSQPPSPPPHKLTFPPSFYLDLFHLAVLFLISPSFFSHLSFSTLTHYCALDLFSGAVHDPIGYRH